MHVGTHLFDFVVLEKTVVEVDVAFFRDRKLQSNCVVGLLFGNAAGRQLQRPVAPGVPPVLLRLSRSRHGPGCPRQPQHHSGSLYVAFVPGSQTHPRRLRFHYTPKHGSERHCRVRGSPPQLLRRLAGVTCGELPVRIAQEVPRHLVMSQGNHRTLPVLWQNRRQRRSTSANCWPRAP